MMSVHSVLNKVTGAMLFLLPFSLLWRDGTKVGAAVGAGEAVGPGAAEFLPLFSAACAIVCAAATAAALQEFFLVLRGEPLRE